MKKTILFATLLVALCAAAFAGDNNADKKLSENLKKALYTSSSVQWSTGHGYKKGTFSFNGKPVAACYGEDDNLIGFSIPISTNDLPALITEGIAKKYSDWNITETILFVDYAGNTNYFARVKKGKKDIALKISLNGKASVYDNIPVSN